jgi:hypothetical protein
MLYECRYKRSIRYHPLWVMLHNLLINQRYKLAQRPSKKVFEGGTLQISRRQLILMFIKVKERFRDRRCIRLILRIMIWFQIRVSQCFLDRNPFHGIEGQEFIEEVEGEGIGVGEHASEGDFTTDRETL